MGFKVAQISIQANVGIFQFGVVLEPEDEKEAPKKISRHKTKLAAEQEALKLGKEHKVKVIDENGRGIADFREFSEPMGMA